MLRRRNRQHGAFRSVQNPFGGAAAKRVEKSVMPARCHRNEIGFASLRRGQDVIHDRAIPSSPLAGPARFDWNNDCRHVRVRADMEKNEMDICAPEGPGQKARGVNRFLSIWRSVHRNQNRFQASAAIFRIDEAWGRSRHKERHGFRLARDGFRQRGMKQVLKAASLMGGQHHQVGFVRRDELHDLIARRFAHSLHFDDAEAKPADILMRCLGRKHPPFYQRLPNVRELRPARMFARFVDVQQLQFRLGIDGDPQGMQECALIARGEIMRVEDLANVLHI
jgi:hypothetical protein